MILFNRCVLSCLDNSTLSKMFLGKLSFMCLVQVNFGEDGKANACDEVDIADRMEHLSETIDDASIKKHTGTYNSPAGRECKSSGKK